MTTPQQVLSDEQIDALKWHLEASEENEQYTGQKRLVVSGHREFARAIESATLKAVSGQEPHLKPYAHHYRINNTFDAFELGAEPPPDDAYDAGTLVPLYTLPSAQPAPVDERAAFDARYDAFEFRREYDKYGPTEAAWSVWQARAALQGAQAPQAGGWLPIETAPKDGTRILIFAPLDGVLSSTFEHGLWQGLPWRREGARIGQPTLWQPLPPAPQATKGNA